MQRMGMVLRLRPDQVTAYCQLHAAVWPQVLARLSASHITNYSIFLRQPENLLFSYFEYTGTDYAADAAAIAADPVTQDWWAICEPMQDPLPSRAPGAWWAGMAEVFHHD
jgi:L-rhamnose mutarotase